MRNISTFQIKRACDLVLGQSRLAELLDVTPSAVNQWVRGRRPVPASYCPAIEAATDGKVTRKDLRPDDWEKIWPELAEEPVSTSRRSTDPKT